MQQRQYPQLNIQEEVQDSSQEQPQFQQSEQPYYYKQEFNYNQYAQYNQANQVSAPTNNANQYQYPQQNKPDQVFDPTNFPNQYQYAKFNEADLEFTPNTNVNQQQNLEYQQTIHQPILPNNDQAPQNLIDYHQLESTEAYRYQGRVKLMNFIQQRSFLLSIMRLFILWSCLYILLLGILLYLFAKSMWNHKLLYDNLLVISIFMQIPLHIVGIMIQYKNYSKQIYFVTIIFYTLTNFSYIGSIATESDQLTDKQIFAIGFFIAQGANFITTIIMIFYLLIEKEGFYRNRFICMVITLIVFLAILFSFMGFYQYLDYLFIYIILALPYLLILPHSLIIILKGGYTLEGDQIFKGALGANFALYVCCCIKT